MRSGVSFVLLAALVVASSARGQDVKPPAPSPARETDAALVAKIRALRVVEEPKTVDALLDLIAQKSDAVRETAFAALLRTKNAACLDEICVHGLAHADGVVRGYAARACGKLHLDAAKQPLRSMIEDVHWLARAEAAVASAELKDVSAMPAMRRGVASDPSEKTRAAAMDALAMFHGDAASAVPVVAKMLDHEHWQIRVAAAQALGEIGSMEGIEPLITRMQVESGRVRNDIYEALKRISRDDLGRNPDKWREWWNHAKGRPGPDWPPPPNLAGGLAIYTNRVAFVVDTSASMTELFTPDAEGVKLLSHESLGRSKLDICKAEIAQAVAVLDPRAHFNVVAFGAQVRSFQATFVPLSELDAASLDKWLRALTAQGTANYFAGLRAAVALGDEPDDGPRFRDTPDTITLICDGVRAQNELLDPGTLVDWYTSMNRYARVTTHVFCLGTRVGDVDWLRHLAERNGGVLTLVKEKTP